MVEKVDAENFQYDSDLDDDIMPAVADEMSSGRFLFPWYS